MSRYRPNMEFGLVLVLAALAIAVRLAGRHEMTADMRIFFVWYGKLDRAGGFAGLSQEIGNYNAPFLYLFAILTYLPGAVLTKIKITWFLFDVLLVFFTYKTVAMRWPESRRIPTLAALMMAFLPTVVINSSFYGQCDNIWAAFALGGLYHLLKGNDWAGASLFTVALAFKPQAIFIFPVLALMILLGQARWRSLIAIPVVYVLLDVPAFIAGRNVVELLTLYSPSRQSQYVPALTSNAASVFAYLPVDTRKDSLKALGYAFAAALVVGLLYAAVASVNKTTKKPSPETLVVAAGMFVVLVPWVLPGMHERYFYLADVMALVVAFYRPRLWLLPIAVQASSLLSYVPFLFGKRPMSLMVPATIMLVVLLVLISTFARRLIDPQGGQSLLQFVGLDQDLARLRPLGGPDDAPRLHEVHEPPGLGKPDAELALQHRGGAEL